MRAVSQPYPAPLLPHLHPRRGAAERRPGGAGGCTPTCLGERALSQPQLLGWRRRDLRNAPPSPRSQPPWRLRRSFRDPAPPLRTALPSTIAGGCREAGRPHLRAAEPVLTWFSAWRGRSLLPGVLSQPTASWKVHRRAFPRRQHPPETLLQLAFCMVPS